MTSTTTKPATVQPESETAVYLFDDWFDPIEAGLRDRVRDFIETMIRTELDAALARPRYARRPDASDGSDGAAAGVNGHRVRADGQKVLLSVKDMGGEATEAWRTVLDDLIARDLRRPAAGSPMRRNSASMTSPCQCRTMRSRWRGTRSRTGSPNSFSSCGRSADWRSCCT